MSRKFLVTSLLALFPVSIIILTKPINFNKYKIKQESTFYNHNRIDAYYDTDHNGVSELFRLYDFTDAKLALTIYDENENVVHQYNSKYFMPKNCGQYKVFFADINSDKSDDIIFLSQNEDSVFLNIFSYNGFKALVSDKFITTIGLSEKKDYEIEWLCAKDVNDDNFKELYFTINGKFALYPRRIFRYNLKNDSLIASKNTGAKQRVNCFENEAKKVIFFSTTSSTNNCKEDYPYLYHDTCSWLFGYNKELNFIFNPFPFNKRYLNISKVNKGVKSYFLFTKTETNNQIYSIDEQGKLIKLKDFERNFTGSIIPLDIAKEIKFFILNSSIDILSYNELNPKSQTISNTSLSKKLRGKSIIESFDIDFDGLDEHFALDNADGGFYIFRNRINNKVRIPINKTIAIWQISSKETDNGIKLIITTQENIYYLTYFVNPFYYWKIPFWIFAFIVSYLFVLLIQKQAVKRIETQNELKDKIKALQLKNTQNQLDPHFTFNAINIVAANIYKDDRDFAYNLLERFSRLMRSSLAFSDKIFRPLKDELQFTEDYLEFQKTRFENKFDFEVVVYNNEVIENIKVPKLIIQGFAENCVKHAFKDIQYKGEIIIEVFKDKDTLQIIIEDNGIGIKKSKIKNPVPVSGYGISATQKQIDLINQLYNTNITIDIIDKSDQNNDQSGSIVTIFLRTV